MALPKTVQRQLDAAEATQQALVQGAEAQNEGVIADVRELTPTPAPGAAPAPPAPSEPAPTVTPTPNNDPFEQKFRTLQGMWNAERAQNKALESQIALLTKQIDALTAASNKPAPAPEPAKPDPRDAAQFGEDLVDMVQRYVTRAIDTVRTDVADYAGRIDARVKTLEERVLGVSQKTEMTLEQTFYAALDDQVPDWRRINSDEAWLAWLAEEDEIYGATRQQALDAAHQRFDARRVISIFKKFGAEHAARRPTLDNQRTPSGASSAPTPHVEPAKKVVSSKLIKQFYDDLARGRYRGREAEAERLQSEIDRAVAEGRVV